MMSRAREERALPLLLVLFLGLSGSSETDPYAARRKEMVEEQIVGRGIRDEAVVSAMAKVPRHLFVPEEVRSRAYEDAPQPIGEGQTISQPYIVALMTSLLDLEGGEKVLEIGTGSGYQAAVLAEIAGEVYSIEIVPSLHERASKTLRELGYRNVHLRLGNGYAGWKEYAPFDAIVVTAAAPRIPKPLTDQLADGGVMVIPVGRSTSFQTLQRVKRVGGEMEVERVTPVRFVPFVLPRSDDRRTD